jgi:hypothetical protein
LKRLLAKTKKNPSLVSSHLKAFLNELLNIFGAATPSVTTISITALSMVSRMSHIAMSIVILCSYAESRYTEGRIFNVIHSFTMLNVVMFNVIVLVVVAPYFHNAFKTLER